MHKGDSPDWLGDVVAAQKVGAAKGLYSICSANRYVIEAAMLQARRDESCVLVESTSNQVNQFGGYTGMDPGAFKDYVYALAADMAFPVDRIVLGGDHVGPNAWRRESADDAMAKARDLVRACVAAGYAKLHIDASMPCGGDAGPGPGWDDVVASRAAVLCAAAEDAAAARRGGPLPRYVIGTEVPPPGGALESLSGVPPTETDGARRTIALNRSAFAGRGLDEAWNRVMGVVVQPGVEFGNDAVVPYDHSAAAELSALIEDYDHLVYEAHSTDYQDREAMREMVKDHFAVLKVGPWLTFALREALFALSFMERELLGGHRGVTLSRFPDVLEKAMLADPAAWEQHYRGSPAELALARRYGLSDRARYYLPVPAVAESVERLVANLTQNRPPLGMLSQYMPNQYAAVCAGHIEAVPTHLIRNHVMEVTAQYSYACGLGTGERSC